MNTKMKLRLQKPNCRPGCWNKNYQSPHRWDVKQKKNNKKYDRRCQPQNARATPRTNFRRTNIANAWYVSRVAHTPSIPS
jgi:hypothetical protein